MPGDSQHGYLWQVSLLLPILLLKWTKYLHLLTSLAIAYHTGIHLQSISAMPRWLSL